MVHIIAIGGGEIGRPGYPSETTAIDEHIVALTKKRSPQALFVPTASGDSASYYEAFQKQYGERQGCRTDVLTLYGKPSRAAIEDAIANADIIYVGGGNTLKMMTLWRKLGVDKLMVAAGERGAILCGLSAGAICWFSAGLSDSRSFTSGGKTWSYISVRGLGIADILLCPHYDAESTRQPALKNSLKKTNRVAIALDNCAALEIKDDQFRVISAKLGARAHKTYWQRGTYVVEDIVLRAEYAPITQLTEISLPRA